MKKVLPLFLALVAIGCSGDDGAPKDDGKPAPEVKYQMVPATTGGGSATPPAPAAPGPKGVNPPSPGSD